MVRQVNSCRVTQKMTIDLQGSHWLTLGLKGSGKSNFNKWLLSKRPRHMIFDPVKEYQGYHRYIPRNTRGDAAVEELKQVTDQVVKSNQNQVDYFYVDEVNRYVSKRGQLDGAVGELIDLNRHSNLGVGFTAILKQKVNTEIRELADYIFIFNLAGKASLEFLDDMAENTRKAMETMGQYECVMLDQNRNIRILSPVPNMDNMQVNMQGGFD